VFYRSQKKPAGIERWGGKSLISRRGGLWPKPLKKKKQEKGEGHHSKCVFVLEMSRKPLPILCGRNKMLGSRSYSSRYLGRPAHMKREGSPPPTETM